MTNLPDWIVKVRDGNRRQCAKDGRKLLTDGWGMKAPGEIAREIVDMTMAADEQVIKVLLIDIEEES